MNSSLTELSALESSDQMYTLRTTSKGSGGRLTYDPKSNIIYIKYDGRTSSLGYELKHAYQFENYQLSFSRDEEGEWLGGILYDSKDEEEAYKKTVFF